MRYPDGGGLDAEERARREQVRLAHLLDMLASSGDLRVSKPLGVPQGLHFYNVSLRL